MKAVIQRVSSAHVTVDDRVVGKIDQGLLVLLGIRHEDSEKEAEWLAEKIAHLRIFADEKGLMNRSAKELKAGILVISQFTLYANSKSGRRPDFLQAAPPEVAEPLYEAFCQKLEHVLDYPVQKGMFRAMMHVHLVNDGPVTLVIQSEG